MRIWKTFVRLAEVHEKWPTQEDRQEVLEDEPQQTDSQFWSNQPDPVLIERGQADAIRLVRSTVTQHLELPWLMNLQR